MRLQRKHCESCQRAGMSPETPGPAPYNRQVRRAIAVASIAAGLIGGWVAFAAFKEDRPASAASPAVSLTKVGDEILVTRYVATDCERFDRVDVKLKGDTATVTVLFRPTVGGTDRSCLDYCPLGTEREVVDLGRFTRKPERITRLVDGGANAHHCAAN